MQPIPRPFFLSFEHALQNRLPRQELMQAMDESMWEYVSLHLRDPAGRLKRPDSLIRIGSICLSFYRLMSKAGYLPEEAQGRIYQACEAFEGPLEPAFNLDGCSVAEYFIAKNASALCEAAFCNRCSLKNEGCPSLDRLRGHAILETGVAA